MNDCKFCDGTGRVDENGDPVYGYIEHLSAALKRAWQALDREHAHTVDTLDDQKRGIDN